MRSGTRAPDRVRNSASSLDVVGYDGDFAVVAHALAERIDERGLARAYGTADADAEGTVRHDLKSLVHGVS